jgi:hypothetical protein
MSKNKLLKVFEKVDLDFNLKNILEGHCLVEKGGNDGNEIV